MKVYLAGMKRAYLPQIGVSSAVLVSFAEKHECNLISDLMGRDVVIDSGAFSVWKMRQKGKKTDDININAYCDFLHAHPYLAGCVALDVIGGSAEQQLTNLEYMRAAKVPVATWPVFHEGDDFELLNEYRRAGYQKIAIAGTKSRGAPSLVPWIWRVLEFMPPSKTLCYHGLAMTQIEVVLSFLEYLDSVDSTTWLTLAQFGPDANMYLLDDALRDLQSMKQILRESSSAVLREIGRLLVEYRFSKAQRKEKIKQLEILGLFDSLEEIA